jgi:hypothetical protein
MPVFATNPETGEQVVYDEQSGQWLKAQFAPTVSQADKAATIAGTKSDVTAVTPQRNIATNPDTGEVKQWNGREWETIEPARTQPQTEPQQSQQASAGPIEQFFGYLVGDPQRRSPIGRGIEQANEMLANIVGFPGRKVGEAISDVSRGTVFDRPIVGGIAPSDVAAGVAQEAVGFFAPGAVARSGQALTRKVLPHLPGAQTAIREMAAAETLGLSEQFRPTTSADDLFTAAKQQIDDASAKIVERRTVRPRGGYPVQVETSGQLRAPTDNLSATVESILAKQRRISEGNQDKGLMAVAEGLKGKIKQGGIELRDYQTELSEIGNKVKSLQSQGFEVNPDYSRLFKAAATDLERLPQGQALREAAKVYRQERALDELDRIVNGVVNTRQGTGATDFAPNRILDTIRKRPFLRDSFDPKALDEIGTILKKFTELPVSPPPRGAAFGFGRSAATAGGIAGPLTLLGVDPATAGAVGVSVSSAADAMRWLLPTPKGRTLVRQVLESGPLDMNKVNRLVAAARGISQLNLPPPEAQGSLE